MLLAQLHGKLTPSEERLADLLTSNVFGALKYSGRVDLLGAFLAGSESPHAAGGTPLLGPILRCEYQLWPKITAAGGAAVEPDAVLRIDHLDRTRSLVFIEARYRDDTSAPLAKDLACEWEVAAELAERERANRLVLVYLTAALTMPRDDMARILTTIRHKTPSASPTLVWLSWRRLPALLCDQREPILVDLAALLRRTRLHDDTWLDSTGFVEPVLGAAAAVGRPRTLRREPIDLARSRGRWRRGPP